MKKTLHMLAVAMIAIYLNACATATPEPVKAKEAAQDHRDHDHKDHKEGDEHKDHDHKAGDHKGHDHEKEKEGSKKP